MACGSGGDPPDRVLDRRGRSGGASRDRDTGDGSSPPVARRSLLAGWIGGGSGSGAAADDGLAAADWGPPDRDGWEVTFEDTFSAGDLDGSTWDCGAGHDDLCAGGNNLEGVREDHVEVDDETDRLVIRTSDGPTDESDYTSG